jgi:hypothetical protein
LKSAIAIALMRNCSMIISLKKIFQKYWIFSHKISWRTPTVLWIPVNFHKPSIYLLSIEKETVNWSAIENKKFRNIKIRRKQIRKPEVQQIASYYESVWRNSEEICEEKSSPGESETFRATDLWKIFWASI